MSDDLLVKYLLNEATEQEAAGVQLWVNERPEHARYYQDFKTIWEESRKLAATSDMDVDAAWGRFLGRVDAGKKSRAIALTRTAVLRIAAGLALLIAAGSIFFFLRRAPEMIAVRSGAAPKTHTLPDGSVVTLNRASELRYPQTFTGDSRAVVLNGEAFFEVTPDKVHPFIISANEATVRVVGTSFNVKSSAAATEVIVETGIVDVSRAEEALRLLPNEATTVYKGRPGLAKRKTEDSLYNYYRTREFVCINTPLARLAEILGEAYGVQIEIPEPRLRTLQLTVTFRNESLPEVLRVISETLNIQAEQRGSRVVFRPR